MISSQNKIINQSVLNFLLYFTRIFLYKTNDFELFNQFKGNVYSNLHYLERRSICIALVTCIFSLKSHCCPIPKYLYLSIYFEDTYY